MQEINPIKEEILESAKKVFAKYGYKKTSVNDIAKAAGKAKSSLYHYFESKEKIFVEIVRREMDIIITQSCLEAVRQNNPIDKMHAFVFSGLGSLSKVSREYGDTVISEFFDFLPLIKELMKDHANAQIEFIKSIIDEGVGKGIFETDNSHESACAFGFAFIGFSEDSPLQNLLHVDLNTAERLFRMLISGLMIDNN